MWLSNGGGWSVAGLFVVPYLPTRGHPGDSQALPEAGYSLVILVSFSFVLLFCFETRSHVNQAGLEVIM